MADSNLVNVIDPNTQQVGSIPQEQLQEALANGYQQASSSDVDQYLKAEKFGTTGQQLATAAEGAASAATFGLSSAVERGLGVSPEDIEARREINPLSHMAGQVAGLVGSSFIPGLGEAEVGSEVAGAAAKEAINPLSASSIMGGLGEKAAAQVGGGPITQAAVRLATENAIFQAGDENSKWLAGDPNQTIETAAANVGLAGLIGAGGGAILGSVSPLWEAASGSKLAQGFEDFKGRLKEHLTNPNPVGEVTNELTNFHSEIKGAADEVYGAQGLKAKAIEKAMPEMSDQIAEQAGRLSGKLNDTITNMRANPDMFPGRLVSKLENSFKQFNDQVAGSANPSELFDAMNELKQMTQSFAKYDKRIPSTDESYDFIQSMKGLSHDLKSSLEDSEVWGKAADVQKSVNKAFSEYLPSLKDFEKRFTADVAGERVLDPGKINTYMNQLGNPNAEIKQSVMKSFLESSQKYKDQISKIYSDIGAENPIKATPLNHTSQTLEAITPGAKIADAMVRKGLARLGGETIGGGIGAGLGSLVGHTFLGALVGEHALGPFFQSILPSLVKPILEKEASATGLKSAVDVAAQALKGESLLNKSAKAVFHGGFNVLPQAFISEKHIDKLDDRLKALQQNPNDLMNMGGQLGHYAPQHASAMAQTSMNAVNVLNSLRPNPSKQAPLDSEPVVSKAQTAKFRNSLEIAQHPVGLLEKVKDGIVQANDVMLMKQLYPSLYAKTVQKLTNEMANHLSENGKINYKTRMGLSLFMAQPLDSTMTPQGIQMHQIGNKSNIAPSQQQSMVKPSKSSPALGKMAASEMTAGQQAESRRLK